MITQVTWSTPAEKEPCMWGRATLATEVSTACIMVASMVAKVIMKVLLCRVISTSLPLARQKREKLRRRTQGQSVRLRFGASGMIVPFRGFCQAASREGILVSGKEG